MAYKAPVWEDGNSPPISAENLNALSQAVEGAQVLYGNSAPTSATKGAIGQYYLVVVSDSQGNYPLYQCVGISNSSYIWELFEYASKYVSSAVADLLGLGPNSTINDALLALGTPYAGQGVLRVSCLDVNGNPVSGCVVQIEDTWGISSEVGLVTFALNAASYSVSVRAPIDYGMTSMTYSVTIPLGDSITLNATIEDSTGGTQELMVTSSVTRAAFSNRVVSADAFCVGGGGSGAASRRYPSNDKTTCSTGGAGGYTKLLLNIDVASPLVLTVGSGGAAVAASNTQEVGRNGNAGGTTTIKDFRGTTILSAAGGSGGTYNYSTGLTGVAGGSGSAAVAVISEILYAGQSGADGASGAAASGYSGGAGQGTTTRLWHESGGELFASAGASAIASIKGPDASKNGTPGTGGGTAYSMVGTGSSTDYTAGSATTYGSGGGAIAVLTSSSSGSMTSGAGMQGLIAFRWEVSA